jgi:cell division septation protein DedD
MSDKNNYFSRENRLARRARRLAEYDSLTGMGSAPNAGRLTTQNAAHRAMQLVRETLDGYRMPATPKLSYSGIRNARTAQSSSKLEDGVLTIFAELRTLSGIKVGFDIPIEIHNGELQEPSVVVIDGAPRIIAQSTFDDVVDRATIRETQPPRAMYSAPMSQASARDAYANRSLRTKVNNGMFSVGANRQALKDAIAGKCASPEDYDTDTEKDPVDPARNQQDDDWLDPAERYEQHDLHSGMETTLKEELEIGDRGGVKYELSKGTKCTIVRDHAGDNKSFVVRFEDGMEAIVERHFLKSGAAKPPKAPKQPKQVKPTKQPKPTKQTKQPKPKKQPKVCPVCNQSPCICHRKKKSQAIEDIGVNIANEKFPEAIDALLKIWSDLSNVELYLYKGTLAACPMDEDVSGLQSPAPEIYWNGSEWMSFGVGQDDMPHTAQTSADPGLPFPAQFPKKCNTCGKTYATAEEFKALPPPAMKGYPEPEWVTDFAIYDIRNCPCGSTLVAMSKKLLPDEPDDEAEVLASVTAQVQPGQHDMFPHDEYTAQDLVMSGEPVHFEDTESDITYADDLCDDVVCDDVECDDVECDGDSIGIEVEILDVEPSIEPSVDEMTEPSILDEELIAKVNEELNSMQDSGLSEIDAKQAIQSKYGESVMRAVFHKVGPEEIE